jgi:antitoxin VapB
MMTRTAKIFKNGRSQAVRLPAEFRFKSREVLVEKQGDALIIRPKPDGWDDFFASRVRAPADFLAARNDLPPQEREIF